MNQARLKEVAQLLSWRYPLSGLTPGRVSSSDVLEPGSSKGSLEGPRETLHPVLATLFLSLNLTHCCLYISSPREKAKSIQDGNNIEIHNGMKNQGIPFFSSISGMNRMVKNESKKSTRLCCFHRTPKKCFLILEKIHERAKQRLTCNYSRLPREAIY